MILEKEQQINLKHFFTPSTSDLKWILALNVRKKTIKIEKSKNKSTGMKRILKQHLTPNVHQKIKFRRGFTAWRPCIHRAYRFPAQSAAASHIPSAWAYFSPRNKVFKDGFGYQISWENLSFKLNSVSQKICPSLDPQVPVNVTLFQDIIFELKITDLGMK